MRPTCALLFLVVLACDKTEKANVDPKPSATTVTSAAPTASQAPIASAVDTSVTEPTPTASAIAKGTVRTGSSTVTVASSAPPAPPPPPGEGMHFDGNHFAVDIAAPAACTQGAACTFTVKLSAKDDFHVNKEYPYKLIMEPSTEVDFQGTDASGAQTFSKAAGDFAFDGEKGANMTVKLKSKQAGLFAVGGTFKLSVCSAANCLLETAKVHAKVPSK